jgi:hypothetical protein
MLDRQHKRCDGLLYERYTVHFKAPHLDQPRAPPGNLPVVVRSFTPHNGISLAVSPILAGV